MPVGNFKVGDLVQRKPGRQGYAWARICRKAGMSPDSYMTVEEVASHDGDITLKELPTYGPAFWFWFDKIEITDLDQDDQDCL